MKKIFLLASLVACYATVQAQTDSVKSYVTAALDLMKSRSVNKAKINWNDVYAATLKSAESAKTIKETYPIIKKALGQLGDEHSKFYPPEAVASLFVGYHATGKKFPYATAKLIDGQYAYITIPAIGCYNFKDWDEYATFILNEIQKLDANKLKGWIIDVRENDGGMFSPMYAAISPFVGSQKVVGSRDANHVDTYFTFNKGKMLFGNELEHEFNIGPVKLKNQNKPIIVLTSKTTASSGEFVTMALAGLPNTKLLGTYTQGLTSSNQEHRLSDNAFLVVTEGSVIDRRGKPYDEIGKGIAPHINLKNVQNDNEVLDAAKDAIDKMTRKYVIPSF